MDRDLEGLEGKAFPQVGAAVAPTTPFCGDIPRAVRKSANRPGLPDKLESVSPPGGINVAAAHRGRPPSGFRATSDERGPRPYGDATSPKW